MMNDDYRISAIFFFSHDPREMRLGDTLGVVWFGVTLVFGIAFRYSGNTALMDLQERYIYLSMACALFLAYYFWRISNQKGVGYPNVPTFVFKTCFIPLVFMAILYVIGLGLRPLIAGTVIPTLDFGYWLFEYTQIVPIEEIAFRGLVIEVIVIAVAAVRDLQNHLGMQANLLGKKSPAEGSITSQVKENAGYLLGGIVSAVLFGVLHHVAYPGQIYPLVYLTMLGFALSYLRFKYGIAACMLLHALNNIIASVAPGILLAIAGIFIGV